MCFLKIFMDIFHQKLSVTHRKPAGSCSGTSLNFGDTLWVWIVPKVPSVLMPTIRLHSGKLK